MTQQSLPSKIFGFGFMNPVTPLKSVKGLSLVKLASITCFILYFINLYLSVYPSPSPPFNLILALLLVGILINLQCIVPHFILIGATSSFLWMPSFLILSFGLLAVIHLDSSFSPAIIFWTCFLITHNVDL